MSRLAAAPHARDCQAWAALALALIGALLGVREAQAQTAACVAWVPDGTYTQGEVVTYNGATYTSLINQTDTASSGWNPTIPGLFTPGGSCSGSSPPTTLNPTPAPGVTSGSRYKVVNPPSGLVLDVSGCGNTDGARVQTWALGIGVCNNGAGQKWQFVPAVQTTPPPTGTGKIIAGYYPWWVGSPVRSCSTWIRPCTSSC